MTARPLTRVATIVAVVGVSVVASASTAVAGTPETWTEREPRPILETLGLFVGLPVGLFLVIGVLVAAGASRRGPRYRPDQEWSGVSAWFGAPSDEPAREPVASGSGSPSGGTQNSQTQSSQTQSSGGGASGSW